MWMKVLKRNQSLTVFNPKTPTTLTKLTIRSVKIDNKLKGGLDWLLSLGASFVAITIFGVVTTRTLYKICPSNQILVIQGKGGNARCIHGGGTWFLPVIQDTQFIYVSLQPIDIHLDMKNVLSFENIRVNVPTLFKIGISTKPTIMKNAATRLLQLSREELTVQAREILYGSMRSYIANMPINEIVREPNKLIHQVECDAEKDLNQLGLEIISVTIHDVQDSDNYITNVGRKASEKAIQEAERSVAEQMRIGETGVQKAHSELSIRLSSIERELEIGINNNKMQKEVTITEIEKENRIRQSQYEANAIDGENTAMTSIAQSRSKLRISEAESNRLARTSEREADAAISESDARAQRIASEAEFFRIEAEKRSQLESKARAEKDARIIDATARSEAMRIESEGYADSTLIQSYYQARGNRLLADTKAKGIEMMHEATRGDAWKLLSIDHIPKMLEKVSSSISKMNFGKIVVWGGSNNKIKKS